ncbi:MAG: A/G-specific adenine glycosylase [Alphaproteobacteria bacterium]
MAAAADRLLDWYDIHKRDLPWRPDPRRGRTADPYRIWLGEIMAQQTTLAAVAPYFHDFVSRWPSVHDLARSSLDDVLHGWQGLGYYARARNLHACARVVSRDRDGRFPESEAELRTLPGIGPYSAAAIAAIAFGQPATVVDGNVERVMARLHAVVQPLPAAKARLRALAASLTPRSRPGDYAQAVMDLGAMVCKPRQPDCGHCPWAGVCKAHALGIAGELPKRAAKTKKPLRHGFAFWTMRGDGAVMLRRRPRHGLLGGMVEVPSSPWGDLPDDFAAAFKDAITKAPYEADWRRLPGTVSHSFTHFDLEITVLAGHVDENAGPAGDGPGDSSGDKGPPLWCLPGREQDYALPTVMKKIVAHAQAHASTDPASIDPD